MELLKTHLPKLEKIEGVARKEFIEKSLNAEKEFEAKPGDDENEKNRLDTLKRVYSPDRYFMGIHYHEDNIQVLKNPKKLTAFVE